MTRIHGIRSAWLGALAALLGSCGDNVPASPDAPPDTMGKDAAGPPPPPALGDMLDRMGRPITARLLIATLQPDGPASAARDEYERAGPQLWDRFEAEIQKNLAIFDALDSRTGSGSGCGNQELFHLPGGVDTYQRLAQLFADDQLFIDSTSGTCTAYFSVEHAQLRTQPRTCGGRAPSYDVIDATLTELIEGVAMPPIQDGVGAHLGVSDVDFPFLGPPHESPVPGRPLEGHALP